MLASLTDNTLKQYNPSLKQWHNFCRLKNIDPFSAPITIILQFFVTLFDKGCKYGTLNSTKAALSLILGSNVINNSQIKRFMKGVSKLRPSLPKYNFTWDPAVVLDYLSNLYPNEDLTFEVLSKKLCTLLALVTAHRVQTLSLIRLCIIKKVGSVKFIINISDPIKTSGINRMQPTLILPYYNERPSICPARVLDQYLSESANRRPAECDFLFISFKKPYKRLGSQSLSRWIKTILGESGIDINQFSAHSTRHASTSAARRLGVSIDVIKKTAGWTANSQSFAKFYNREVLVDDSESYARSLCRMVSDTAQ